MFLRRSMLSCFFLGCVLATVAGCGGGASEHAASENGPLEVKASAVGGGFLHYDDLASQDTVLWFWAPW